MKVFNYFLKLSLLTCLTLGASTFIYAQTLDEEAVTLSEQETARLRAILEQPIDPNSLKATQVEAYKQKQGAAWKLGDAVKQEEILREWMQMDTDVDPKWRLMRFDKDSEISTSCSQNSRDYCRPLHQ
jgi:hypothetical protein